VTAQSSRQGPGLLTQFRHPHRSCQRARIAENAEITLAT
jgi:hypothetical protein